MWQGDDAPKRALYTDTWRLVIPAVYNKCPSCPMALNATVSTAPHTAIQPGLGMVTTGALLCSANNNTSPAQHQGMNPAPALDAAEAQ